MNSGIEIANGQVAQLAAQMRVHGEDYTAALRRLQERGYGCGTWGDNTGLFAALHAEYASCGASGLAALSGLSGVMGATGDGLDTARSRIADVDAAAAEESARASAHYQV
jgi:hypothetical protein